MPWINNLKKFAEEEGNIFKEEYAKGGGNPNDITRELIIPALALVGTTCAGTNLAIEAVKVNLNEEVPDCISVEKATVISTDEDLMGRCVEDLESLETLTSKTIDVHGMVLDVLVMNCGFDLLVVDNKKGQVVATDDILLGVHHVQRSDNNWTVAVDGFAELKHKEGIYEPGTYTSFLQPVDEFSMQCANQFLSQTPNMPFENPAEFICNVHFDPISTFNGEGYGESIVPVIGCGSIKATNPTNLEGSGVHKNAAHYNHIPIRETY